jgi:hypothetical protein
LGVVKWRNLKWLTQIQNWREMCSKAF